MIEKFLGAEIADDKLVEGLKNLLTYLDGCVLCFDDLERIDTTLNIQQVLGYINTNYIEHLHIRTIFVSNEDKLLHMEEFKDIREKVIGRTIKFQRNIEDIIPILIESNYDSSSLMYKFIMQNTSLICELLKLITLEFNIRTLQFVFDNFNHIINRYGDRLGVDEEEENFNITLSIFLNVLLLSVEYKKGKITSKEEIEFIYSPSFKYRRGELTTKESESYKNYFFDSYLINKPIIKDNVLFYREIGLLILEGTLNIENFVKEVHRMKKQVTNSKELAVRNIYSFQELEFHELKSSIQELLTGVKEGYYQPQRYPELFKQLCMFIEKGYFECKKEELYQDFRGALEISLEDHEFENAFEDPNSTNIDNNNTNEYYNELVKLIIEAQRKQMEKVEQSIIMNFFDVLKSNDQVQLPRVYNEIRYKKELFSVIDLDTLSDDILSWSNKSLSTFKSFLRGNYLGDTNSKVKYKDEVPFLEKLITLIDKKMQKLKHNIDPLKYDVLSSVIEQLNIIKEDIAQ